MKRDFLDDLLALIGNDPEKYMIEQSLFFSTDVVDAAFDELVQNLNAGNAITIRKSTKQGVASPYRDVAGTLYWNNIYRLKKLDNIKVCLDVDGNREVRRLINSLTGTVVSQGQNSDIKFGKISHIWGETSNPFFFSSLWNVVIVPAYFNDILDKNAGADPRVNMILEQYKAVCWDRYDVAGKLSKLGLTPSEIQVYEPTHKIAHNYSITEIGMKMSTPPTTPPTSPTTTTPARKVGQIANQDLRNVLQTSSKVTPKDIADLCNKSISHSLFGITFPVLATTPSIRYYKNPLVIHGKQYYLCSQWIEKHRVALENWINTH